MKSESWVSLTMNEKRSVYGFLTEFLVMIFVFALVSVVSVTMFARGKNLSEEAIAYNEGLLASENVAERLKGYNGEDIGDYLSSYPLEGAEYRIEVSISTTEGIKRLYTSVVCCYNMKSDKLLMEFEVSSIGSDDYD